MQYKNHLYSDLSVKINLSELNGEHHAMFENTDTTLCADTQYRHIEQAVRRLAETDLPPQATLVLKRYFVSDAINHASLLPKNERVAVSIVQQPPLSGAKAALWAYWVDSAEVAENGENAVAVKHSAYTHLFDMQLHNHSKDEFAQTEKLFRNYTQKLNREACSLKDNAIRTWIYVQGVDTHYADMVKARRLHFYEQGLTEHTHYLASTGIEGKYLHPETTVLMDAYAIAGIAPEQLSYLKGASHLNPTHEYGVTFERATTVDYGDRRHIFVSGTASIDNSGNIVHPLNISRQTERTFENIGVLLNEGNAAMTDIAQMIVYLRDTADCDVVATCIERHCPDIPKTIVWAPVCRPGWLIEIECIAVKAMKNDKFDVF